MNHQIPISDEMWNRLHELCGDAWLDDGHQAIVVETLLGIAIPIQEEKIKGQLLL